MYNNDSIGWITKPLGDFVASLGDGGTPSRDDPRNFGGDIPWVVIDDIQRQIYETKENLSKEGINKSSAKCWPAESLILSTGATIGKVGIAMVPMATKQGITGIICNNKIIPQYLYYLLLKKKSKIQAWAQGSTFAEIRPPILVKLPIKVPTNKSVQEKIVCILKHIDEAIEKTESLIAKYQKIKAGLMHDLFTRGVTADGKLRQPREQAPELYQETAIGWIPKEWQIILMVDLAEDRKGATTIGPFGSDLVTTDYRLEGVPVIFVRDIKESGFEWNSETYVSDKKAQQLRAHSVKSGEVLATKMGLPPCISCLFPEWMPNGVITADMIRLSPDNKKVDSYWLTTAINHDRVKRQVAAITAGVTRMKVTLADFRGIKIAKPELDEQRLISEKLRIAQNKINAELAQVDKLQSQKLGLMQDLLTGKVPVKVDEQVVEALGD